jgi:hypothetical protein
MKFIAALLISWLRPTGEPLGQHRAGLRGGGDGHLARTDAALFGGGGARHEADRDAWMLEVRQMIVTRLEDRNIKNE